MADQTVKISNMPDSGSPEAVAFKLWDHLRSYTGNEGDSASKSKQWLDLYAECLVATRGYRDI